MSTNRKTNRDIADAIQFLALAMPAREKARAELISFAIRKLESVLKDQPRLQAEVGRQLRSYGNGTLTLTDEL